MKNTPPFIVDPVPTDPSENVAVTPQKVVATPVQAESNPPGPATEVVNEPFAAISAAEALTLALSPPQRTAIEFLTSGKTAAAAVQAAEVNRTTLYRWLKGDAAFIAAHNARQRDMVTTARGRMLSLSDLAVNTVAKAMTKGDAQIAFGVLDLLVAHCENQGMRPLKQTATFRKTED